VYIRVTYRHEDSTDITYCYIDTLSFDPKVHTSRQTIHSLENLSPIQTFDVHTLPLNEVRTSKIFTKKTHFLS